MKHVFFSIYYDFFFVYFFILLFYASTMMPVSLHVFELYSLWLSLSLSSSWDGWIKAKVSELKCPCFKSFTGVKWCQLTPCVCVRERERDRGVCACVFVVNVRLYIIAYIFVMMNEPLWTLESHHLQMNTVCRQHQLNAGNTNFTLFHTLGK